MLLVEGTGERGTEGGRVKQGANPSDDSISQRTKLLLGVGNFGEDPGEERVEEGEEGLGEEGGGGDEEEISSGLEGGVGDSGVGIGEVADDGGEEAGEEDGFFG